MTELELLCYMVLGFLFFLKTYDKSYKELNLISYLKVVIKTLIIPILGFGFIHQVIKILVFRIPWGDVLYFLWGEIREPLEIFRDFFLWVLGLY